MSKNSNDSQTYNELVWTWQCTPCWCADKFFRQNQAVERTQRASYHEAIHLGFPSENARPSDVKAKLTKEDIGLPTNFRHLTHVAWDSIAIGSPPKDYISPPTNFQHVTHISQPSKTVMNSAPRSEYISAPANFRHLTHKSWDLARSPPNRKSLSCAREKNRQGRVSTSGLGGIDTRSANRVESESEAVLWPSLFRWKIIQTNLYSYQRTAFSSRTLINSKQERRGFIIATRFDRMACPFNSMFLNLIDKVVGFSLL